MSKVGDGGTCFAAIPVVLIDPLFKKTVLLEIHVQFIKRVTYVHISETERELYIKYSHEQFPPVHGHSLSPLTFPRYC